MGGATLGLGCHGDATTAKEARTKREAEHGGAGKEKANVGGAGMAMAESGSSMLAHTRAWGGEEEEVDRSWRGCSGTSD